MPVRRGLVAVSVALIPLLPGATPAGAVPGTWGAGGYRYDDGRTCRSGITTSPLAAWTVSGGHRAYLTRTISSDGRTDSAVPPIPSAGTPDPAVEVAPGPEFAVPGDIAATAYAITHGGDAATIAATVLSETGSGSLPSCADAGRAAALLATARELAGPYQVTVTPPGGTVRVGHAVPVVATVRTASGRGVPGAQVTLAADGASFAHGPLTTAADGTVHDDMTLDNASVSTVTITASTSVSTGLFEATIQATPSFTNPSGASVPAVYASAPETFQGQADVHVDQTAHPVVSTALGSRVFSLETTFAPHANVSGLNGHGADVNFELRGPLPLRDRTLCSAIPATAWRSSDVPVATTSASQVSGDAVVLGSDLTPTSPGCYALSVTAATTDATPAVTRTAPTAVVAFLDTKVTGVEDKPAVAVSGPTTTFRGGLHVASTHGLRGSVRVTLVGPIRPHDGNCGPDASAWAHAPRHTAAATLHLASGSAVTAAGDYEYSVPAPADVGCYRMRPAVVLAAGSDSVTVPATADRPAYVLKPTVTATVQRTWAITPAAVPVQVEIDGLFGLPATVRLTMYVAAPDPAGCAEASFANATAAGNGPDTSIPARPGVVVVATESGPTPRQGCYAVVPELVLGADPRVRVAGAVGLPGSTLIAGVDPTRHIGNGATHGDSGTPLAFVLSMCVLAGIMALVVARVGFVAWRGRDEPHDATWQPLLGPESPGDGLPSAS